LGDIDAGMKQCAMESYQLVTDKVLHSTLFAFRNNEHNLLLHAQHINEVTPDTIPEKGAETGYVFSVEDVLAIQARQHRYSSEFNRRETLVAKLLTTHSCSGDESDTASVSGDSYGKYWLDEDVISEVLASWSSDPFDIKKKT
jgi:hypothetical protein